MIEAVSPPLSIRATISEAFRANRMPCILLNGVVVTLVSSYFFVPSVASAWTAVGDFKQRWAYGFSLSSTIIAAVLMPSAVQWAMGTLPTEYRARRILLLALFWGYRGMEIDLFYHLQEWLFGSRRDAMTLLKKVALDQFVASPLWFVPTYVVFLRWADQGGSWKRAKATFTRDFWLRTCPTVLCTNWLIWIPTVLLVYSLPAPLQFPLFSIVMCFFILLVTLMARR